LLREARLRVAQACVEDIRYKPGAGKTWISCALAHQVRTAGQVLARAAAVRGNPHRPRYLKLLNRLANAPVLILDDWGLIALSTQDRADLLEILDDCLNVRSTVLCSQLPVDKWHAYLGEPTLAHAILD